MIRLVAYTSNWAMLEADALIPCIKNHERWASQTKLRYRMPINDKAVPRHWCTHAVSALAQKVIWLNRVMPHGHLELRQMMCSFYSCCWPHLAKPVIPYSAGPDKFTSPWKLSVVIAGNRILEHYFVPSESGYIIFSIQIQIDSPLIRLEGRQL